ncbi:MAG TPA: hypothetical protein VNK94_02915 [Gaiellaceae bacterium]|nr:hypothetical protein [Gaiellaceae bacterium]
MDRRSNEHPMKRTGVVLVIVAAFCGAPAVGAAGTVAQLKPQLSVQVAKPALVKPALVKPGLVSSQRAKASRISLLRAIGR